MGNRDSNPIIDYALFWLEHSADQIKKEPQRGVPHWTHRNYSGGFTGWEDPMDKIYFEPNTLEECLLQGQIHQVMISALKWALNEAETNTPTEWDPWNGLSLSQAYRIAQMVAQNEPLLACSLKMRLNKISLRMGKNLKSLADINFQILMGPCGI